MNHAMCTLPSPQSSQAILQKEKATEDVSCAQGGPQTGVQLPEDSNVLYASLAPGGGRSRSGI